MIDIDGKPLGGKWSLDAENRKKIPKGLKTPTAPPAPPENEQEDLFAKLLDESPHAIIELMSIAPVHIVLIGALRNKIPTTNLDRLKDLVRDAANELSKHPFSLLKKAETQEQKAKVSSAISATQSIVNSLLHHSSTE